MTEPISPPDLRVIHAGHTPLTAGERAVLEDFIVQPAAPWFSAAERSFIERALAGEFAATADDFFFFLSLGGRLVSHAWYPVSRRQPEVGVLGYVLTDPEFRGRGLSRRVCASLLEHFDRRGGRVMYLGTGNPAARREIARLDNFLSGGEEPVVGEDLLQFAGHGAGGLQLHVPPMPERGIEPLVFAADVHTADEGDDPVDDLKFAVVSEIEKEAVPLRIQALKPGKVSSGAFVGRQRIFR